MYKRQTLQMGKILVFRGRVVKKNNRLTMEQPEIFAPEVYEAIMHSMQPIYGQTRGCLLYTSALKRSDVIILTGGLGPTEDDLTKEVCAEVMGFPLEELSLIHI